MNSLSIGNQIQLTVPDVLTAKPVITVKPTRTYKQTLTDYAPGPYKLTVREFQVLQLIYKGYDNKKIAAELKTAISTVKFHKTGLFKKYGVNNAAKLLE